jgi:hypothetical protein
MRPECTSKQVQEQWELPALELERRTDFLYCLGTVDAKHRVIKQEHSESMFYNYKDFFRGINGRGRH